MISSLVKIGLALGGVYLLFALSLYLGQKKLVYIPDRTRIAPGVFGLEDVAELVFEPAPDIRVMTWYVKASPGHPTILYFHGNAGNLAARADRVRDFQEAGFGVLIMSYRGYSGGTGSPSEGTNISDGLHVYDWLRSKGIGGNEIVLYGESLGSGVAVQLAAQRDVGGVILDAPFSSLTEVAQHAYPFVPVSPFLTERYESDKHVAGINAPLLILHGARDGVIPVAFGQSLFKKANEPKKIVVFPTANHSDLFLHGAMREIRGFVNSLKRN